VSSPSTPWPSRRLGEICELKYGKSLPECFRSGGSIPVYGSNGIVGSHDSPLTAGETIIIGRKGSHGEVNFSHMPCWPIDTTYYVDATATHENLHWLRYRLAGAGLNRMNRAAAVPGLNREDAYRVEILVPPPEEQRRIAAILDKAETLRTQRRAALAQLDSLTQSIFLNMFGDPRDNSRGWKQAAVGALTDCIVPGRDKPKSFSGGIPWITTANLIHMGTTLPSSETLGLSQSEIDEVRAKVIPFGSVIISCVGDLGIVSIAGVPIVINQQLHSFQCGPGLNNLFLMYCLSFQKAFMLAKASSTTLPYMNKSVCNSVPVIVPPLNQQQNFAARVQAVDVLKITYRRALVELDAIFASLQQRAFSGEL
jgi:type I restriction enzyme, S subunit